MNERVRMVVEDGVAEVVLNRPDKRNGLDLAMFEGLVAAGERVCDDRNVRAVVLRGEGAAFCAGLDFKWFMSAPDQGRKLLERSDDSSANLAQRIAWIWQQVPMPVIAAVHGVAFGGGLQLALGADMRYVAPDAQLSVMEIRWGLIPDMSITQTLPHLVGADVARELVFTGRIVSGDEAARIGLATRVCDDPVSVARDTARTIAAKSPQAIRAGKQLLQQAPRLERDAAFRLETELQLRLIGSPDQLEAVQANLAKRPPVFRDEPPKS